MVRYVCGLCDREALEAFLTRWFLVIVSCPIAEIPRFCSRILPFYHEVFFRRVSWRFVKTPNCHKVCLFWCSCSGRICWSTPFLAVVFGIKEAPLSTSLPDFKTELRSVCSYPAGSLPKLKFSWAALSLQTFLLSFSLYKASNCTDYWRLMWKAPTLQPPVGNIAGRA